MIKLTALKKLGRAVRLDDTEDLGQATAELICQAIDEGRYDDAKALARYTVPEGKALHDLFCDWIWDLLTQVAKRHGEQEMFETLRDAQSTWMLKRTWKGFLGLSIEQRVQFSAEMMRAHHSGPQQDGGIEVIEEQDRFVIKVDPCGSGGRMRRGDPVDGTPSRLGQPYNFGKTSKGYDWSWGKQDVPYYCVHCCVNEIMPMEWGGHPMWVTAYDPDAGKPCAWYVYKTAEAIPEEYYTRVGRKKPAPGEGQY
jgi:hypothetical protein